MGREPLSPRTRGEYLRWVRLFCGWLGDEVDDLAHPRRADVGCRTAGPRPEPEGVRGVGARAAVPEPADRAQPEGRLDERDPRRRHAAAGRGQAAHAGASLDRRRPLGRAAALVSELGEIPTVLSYERHAATREDLPSSATLRNRLGRWSAITTRLAAEQALAVHAQRAGQLSPLAELGARS